MTTRLPLTLREYLIRTRSKGFCIITIVGLLALYEAGLVITDEPHRNAADVLLKDAFAWFGPLGVQVFHGSLVVLFFGAFFYYLMRSRSVLRYFLPFLAESMIYAVLLSPAVLFVAKPYLASSPAGHAILDIGAGVYEEILFRLLILRGFTLILGIDPFVAFFDDQGSARKSMISFSSSLVIPILVSALTFAAYHHIGPYGDPLLWPLFIFRFIAGLLLAQLFFLRGLAVCVYAHAMYDLLVHFVAS